MPRGCSGKWWPWAGKAGLAVNVRDDQVQAAHQGQGVGQQHALAGLLEQAEVGKDGVRSFTR